ncbi:hypothetical protein ASPZODRAFT_137449 [Penicilliopsis zonata CBS 506.65]|uniref:Uncharacterized protein n=1 Tax=Penicilliopsis zonata CBS 506.65 TaxID=1073090 RepID=A0A1L9S4U2_9EURO|nr:hypothetical protein ASPZODRAFT_137449 [Penicilliopsis zonata CBS 506.65]OJJ42188.1 hypothetical protein ASPZODRAFT_137449 [Penicilliopsis zonata CBS 506.65]
MFFNMKSVVGLLALSMVAVAAPADDFKRAPASSLDKRTDCFGGSYGTCVIEYFELFCLAQCKSDDGIAVQDCRTQCDTAGGVYCQEEC